MAPDLGRQRLQRWAQLAGRGRCRQHGADNCEAQACPSILVRLVIILAHLTLPNIWLARRLKVRFRIVYLSDLGRNAPLASSESGRTFLGHPLGIGVGGPSTRWRINPLWYPFLPE